jgi:hypothetical protein
MLVALKVPSEQIAGQISCMPGPISIFWAYSAAFSIARITSNVPSQADSHTSAGLRKLSSSSEIAWDKATQVSTRRKIFPWIVNSLKNWALTFQSLEGVE